MTDDDLRAQLRALHADDAPPTFDATVTATRRRARRVVPVIVGALAIATAVLLFVRRPTTRPAPPSTIGMTTTTLRTPLDSLLDVPDQTLLSTTPDLTRGAVP